MHHPHHRHVLQLDIQGTSQAWISLEHAALHVATGSVAWVDGDGPLATLRGGYNVARGGQSVIDIHPIMALTGSPKVNLFDVVPAFTKAKLFRRDRMTCAPRPVGGIRVQARGCRPCRVAGSGGYPGLDDLHWIAQSGRATT